MDSKTNEENQQEIVVSEQLATEEAPSEDVDIFQLADEARALRESGKRAEAAEAYAKIAQIDPLSWEAAFYAAYLRARGYRRNDITKAPKEIKVATMAAIDLIHDHIDDPEVQLAALTEMAAQVDDFGNKMHAVSLKKFHGTNAAVRFQFLPDLVERLSDCVDLMYSAGDKIKDLFPQLEGVGDPIATLWAQGVKINVDLVNYVDDKEEKRRIVRERTGRVRQYNAAFMPPKEEKPSFGCYVATCAYGSYDCPQVWTLRRFRDNQLAKSAAGRAFIRVYYALSPKLVERFGSSSWFKALCLKPLNALVAKLNAQGVEDTPYEDRVW